MHGAILVVSGELYGTDVGVQGRLDEDRGVVARS